MPKLPVPKLLAALLALPPLALTAADRPDRVPAATPAGEPRSCIPIIGIDQSRVRSDQVIDFVMRDRRVYRVTLPQPCPELGFEQRFVYETSLSELCSTDIVTVLRTGGAPLRGASCGLAPFQPVTLAPKTR